MGATNQRLDQFLRQRFPSLTRRQAEEAADGGLVKTAAGAKVKKGLRGFAPESLDLAPLASHLEALRKGNPALKIVVLQSTPELFVIDKPAGIHSHPLSLFDRDTVTGWAFQHDPQIAIEFPEIQPTVTPHRLDKETSGILLVARTQSAFQKWRGIFSGHAAAKEYLAWCWGSPGDKTYNVENQIGHDARDARKMRVGWDGDPGLRGPFLDAASRIEVLEVRSDKFLARVSCETGVTHQVRVHCADLGFPLVGDELYDPAHAERPVSVAGHLLRAVKLIAGGQTFMAPDAEFRARFPS